MSGSNIGGKMSGLQELISGLKDVAHRIGANPALGLDALPSGDLRQLIARGVILELIPGQQILAPTGEVRFLYIPDHSMLKRYNMQNTSKNRNKVHLCCCDVIQDMLYDGREKRYVATGDTSGVFDVCYSNSEQDAVPLDVCQRCYRMLRSKKYGMYTDFDFSAYARDNDYVPELFERAGTDKYGVDYPDNWKQISFRVRQGRGWTCEQCGRNFSCQKRGLHVHHINGIKSDCRDSNLRVLCEECHSKQPRHGHMC